MGLFSKKEEVPEIPSAPTLPELPMSKEQPGKKDLPGLPTFPSGSKNEDINQEMVKSAVSDMPSPGEEEVHVEIPQDLHIEEEGKGESMIPPKPFTREAIPELPKTASIADMPRRTLEITSPMRNRTSTRQIEPIFVRIDKFQLAQKNLESIKEKVKEIESVLGKIKGVKSKEEELAGWTEDIEKVKARLAEVDSGVFDQI